MVKEPGQRPDTGGQSSYTGAGGPVPNREGQGSLESLAETALSAAERAKSAAGEKIEEQKTAASQSIEAFAQAVRRASDELKNQDQTAAAQLIQQAAGGLESLSKTLSNQSLGDMINTVRDFGRRNPVALAGGAALLGLALGRVARTTVDGSEVGNGHGQQSGSSRQYGASSPSSTDYATRGGYGSASEFPGSRASVASPSVAGKPPSGSGISQSGSHTGQGSESRSASGSQSRSGMGSTPRDMGKRSGGKS